MKIPLVGAPVKLARPFEIEIAPSEQGFLPLVLTPEDMLIFMSEMEGGWHVMLIGHPVPHPMGRHGFTNPQFVIPTEYFEA